MTEAHVDYLFGIGIFAGAIVVLTILIWFTDNGMTP